MAVVHRAMRQDLGRLAACLGQVADRGANPTQARAICALSGLLIAAAGALGPASWAACIRTATALRAE